MLLFTEPFTPGDMVSFTTRGTHYEGKVERVGWYQTRLRGRDTRCVEMDGVGGWIDGCGY